MATAWMIRGHKMIREHNGNNELDKDHLTKDLISRKGPI